MPLLGLIGYPLDHSFSPKFFSEKFKQWGREDYKYLPFPLQDLDEFQNLIHTHPDLIGLNVTIPYKESVIDYLDEVEEEASTIGAVNVIKLEHGDEVRTMGYNTDASGFIEAYRELIPSNTNALVLGTGGASKAMTHALSKLGVQSFKVSRSRERADYCYDDLSHDLVSDCLLIVNTSPAGMYPNVHSMPPLPMDGIGKNHVLIDLVYNPSKTHLMENFTRQGAKAYNGLAMLEAQALLSWDIWTR